MLQKHSSKTSVRPFSGLRASAAFAASVAALTFVSVANAQLAFDQSGGATHAAGGTGTIGYQFNVTQTLTVTELDAYVGAGFPSPTTEVGIWNSSGTLLASANISTTAPAITRPSAKGGNFDGTSIAPLTLSVGTYSIGAYVSNPN